MEGTAASDCSGTVAGPLLLFAFAKRALIVVNVDHFELASGSQDCFRQ